MVCVAVIGYGYWGPNIVRNLKSMGIFVKYIVEIDTTRYQEISRQYPSTIITSKTEIVIKDDEVDAIIVVLPAKLHYPVAKKALINNKHVLIEKPFTTSVLESDELIQIAKEKQRILMVDHTYVYSNAVKEIQRYIEENNCKIIHIESIRSNLGFFRKDVDVLWDLAPHDLSIIKTITGESPEHVCSTGFSHNSNNMLDTASLLVKYPSFTATIHASWISPQKIRMMQIVTNKGIILFDDTEKEEKIKIFDSGFKDNGNEIKTWMRGMSSIITNEEEPLAQMLGDFIQCVKNGDCPKSDMYMGREIVEILERSMVNSFVFDN